MRILIILFISFAPLTYASHSLDSQIWNDLYLVHGNDDIIIRHRIGTRVSYPFNDNFLGHYRIRSSFGRGLLKYRLGTAFFYSQDNYTDNFELRPWGGLQLNLPLRFLRFNNFLRFENRFIDEDFRVWDSTPTGRLRYRFGVGSTLYENHQSKIALKISPEMFINLGNYNMFYYNELRLVGSLNIDLNKKWAAGVNIIHKQIQENYFSLDQNYVNILQFTLKHTIL